MKTKKLKFDFSNFTEVELQGTIIPQRSKIVNNSGKLCKFY